MNTLNNFKYLLQPFVIWNILYNLNPIGDHVHVARPICNMTI
jgi:hypothetical protein